MTKKQPSNTKHTPEQSRAQTWRRLAASLYDGFILVSLLLLTTVIVVALHHGEAIAAGTLWFQAVLLSVVFLYYALCWIKRGATIGMLAWRLQISGKDKRRMTWSMALVRFLLMVVTLLPAGLGFLWIFFDGQRATLYDRLSLTYITKA